MRHLLGLVVLAAANGAWAAAAGLGSAQSEPAVLASLAGPSLDLASVAAADVERFVHSGWHDAVRALITRSHEGSDEDDVQRVATQVRQAVQAERNRLDDLIRALDRNYGRAVDVSPAVQWAQNSTHVFLAVKFAQRWNAPGALEVENTTVDITDCCLNFTAFGEHSFIRRRYRLSLRFLQPVEPSACSWSLASVGRMSVTLTKAAPANWPRMLAGPAPKNLGIWQDMAEKWRWELERVPPLVDKGPADPRGEPTATSASSSRKAKKQQKPRPSGSRARVPEKEKAAASEEDGEWDAEGALDTEVELLSDCSKASYTGSSVAELCEAAWRGAVEQPVVRGRRWLVELYSSQGEGDLRAMRTLMPVWKRLADVFPSMVPGGRVGAVDCGLEKELCKRLGIAFSKLPQVWRFVAGSSTAGAFGTAWHGSLAASIEEFAAFGADRDEL